VEASTYGNDHIDGKIIFDENTLDFVSEGVSHGHTATVYADAIQYRVRSSKIDVFEDVGCKGSRRRNLASGNPTPRDNYSFPWKEMR
jgi:hypothetical protein